MEKKCKCRFPYKMVGPGGFEIDPCVYVEEEFHRNVNVTVSRCKYCGTVSITWERIPGVTVSEYYTEPEDSDWME